MGASPLKILLVRHAESVLRDAQGELWTSLSPRRYPDETAVSSTLGAMVSIRL